MSMEYMEKRIIALGADHNGVSLKSKLKQHLKQQGFHCIDVGPFNAESSVDYVDFAFQIGNLVSNNEVTYGILICGTGIGMSIAANKIPNVRAALVHNMTSAKKSREHNDANILCLGTWINNEDANLEIADAWLNESFAFGRHVRRIVKIAENKMQSPKKNIFTLGIFDSIQPNHIEFLEFSKSLGDYLVVGIPSNTELIKIKKNSSFVISEEGKKKILQSIRHVDEVIVFDSEHLPALIKSLRPHAIVKEEKCSIEEARMFELIHNDAKIKIYTPKHKHS